MSRRILALVVLIAIVGVGVFLFLTRPVEAPSEDIQENTQQLDNDAQAEASGEVAVFRISQEDSTAEFNISEVLRGVDTLVVGTTSEVAGDIRVNFVDPSASAIGQIRINARTFVTDEDRRNSAIARFILQSENEAYEFIEFQPTAVSGLPESVAVGDSFTFQISGDLTILDTTNEVTFDASATYTSEDQISGSAEATVRYADWGITIPDVPFVASVEDDVILKINFVANRVAAE